MKTTAWRPILVIAVLLAAIIYILPTVGMIAAKSHEAAIWPHKKINLGLDLQGGMHLVLQVDTDKAVENNVDRAYDDVRGFLKEKRVRLKSMARTASTTITLGFPDAEEVAKGRGLLADEFRDYRVEDATLDGAPALKMTLKDQEIQGIKKMAAEKALMKVRNRVDAYGAREPDIRPQGKDRIVVQLPGVIDEEKARREIGRTGHLEFKLVDESHDPREALNGKVPAGSQLYYYRKDDPEMAGRPILLREETLLTGELLSEARVQIDQAGGGQPYVAIKFNSKGSRIFAKITEEHIHERLAIVLDGEVYSAPTIQSKIEGEGMITGNFTDETAKNLALVLREAFPTPVKILYEKTVGPSLGEDSIRKGLLAGLIGGVLVIIFISIYYKGSGLIASLALILNLVLILAGLAAFNATLTLPGIAGIVLTTGMSVDANVLIYERMREELRLGKTVRAAVEAGFDRAALTILDSNVTTLIAALVLFQFGTGPVKGFAVTLTMGVLISLFTALVFCRAIFDLVVSQKRIQRLSI